MKKRTRKLLSLLLCCAILLTLLPVTAMAEESTEPEYKYIGTSLDKTADGEPVKILLEKILATEPGTLVEEQPLDQTWLYGKYVLGLWYKEDENGTYTEISGNEIIDEESFSVTALTGPTEPGDYRFILQSAFQRGGSEEAPIYPIFLTIDFTIAEANEHDHTWGSWTKLDDDQHSRTCTCGETQAADHTWDSGTVTTAATCTAAGVMTYTCTDCGATKTETISATDHDVGTSWKYNGTQHWMVCDVCGASVDEASHSMGDWELDDSVSNGQRRICTAGCGYQERRVSNIAISGQPDSDGNYTLEQTDSESSQTSIEIPASVFSIIGSADPLVGTSGGAAVPVGATSVTYNAAAVEAINTAVSTAAGADLTDVSVTLTVDEVEDPTTGNGTHSMNDAQQDTVEAAAESAANVTVYSITLEVTASGETTTISDFGEGTATVTVPYTEEVGENDTVSVVRVEADGSTTPVDSSYDPEAQTVTWTTNSHSFYMITSGTASVPICDGGSTCPSHTFTDLDPTQWYHKEVDYAITNGLMNGYPDGSFQPNTKTSRAMLVTILYRLEGKPPVGSCPFTDVKPGMWYTDAITWAAENHIVEGYGNGKFGPEDTLTREQFAAIMYRYAEYKNYSTTAREDLNIFTDGKDTSSWAKDAMSWAVAKDLFIGFGNSNLNPGGDSLRAQTATVLYRFCENVAR